MSFGAGTSNNGAISTSDDVALNAPADGNVLAYESSSGKWRNAALPLVTDSLVAGDNVVLNYDSTSKKTTISSTASGSTGTTNVVVLAADQTDPPAGTAAGTIILREVS